MNAIKLSILCAASLIGGIAARAQSVSPDEVIRKHMEAVGGVDNWNKIKSMKKVGSVDGNMEVLVTTTVVQDRAARIDFAMIGTNGYFIVTPKEGWAYFPAQGMDKVAALTARQVKLQQGQMDVKDELLDRSSIAKAEFVGRDTIKNMPCLKLKITNKNGGEQIYYFDATTYYIVRRQFEAETQIGDEEITVNYSNFQKRPEGIVVAMTSTMPMMQDAEVVYEKIEINMPVSDDIFKPGPANKK